MDYALPRAHDIPDYILGHTVTPSPVNPLGIKGVGEAGTIGATPAIANAVLDALAPLGITHLDLPMTPERVWADIIIGIQSGSDKLNFEVYNRFITKKQLLKTAQVLNKFKDKLTVMYDVISCNPYESTQDIIDTIQLVLELPTPYFLSVNNLIFFEGTPLYKRALQDGHIKSETDTAEMLNYWDRWQHIKLKKKNPYLNLVLNLMRGVATTKRIGLIPRKTIKKLISDSTLQFNLKHELPTYTVGSMVQVLDYMRENLAKPIYRKASPEFKQWYDKRRYKSSIKVKEHNIQIQE
jgi:radical SAM superfamily enzyme YgiQ (UPF0313 family)